MITETELLALFPATPVQHHSELRLHLYRAADGSVCVKACRAHMLPPGTSLPTRVSQNALDTLDGLRELVAAGVITFSGTNIHTSAPVRVEVIK